MANVVSLVPRGFRTQLRDAQQQRQLVRVWRNQIEPSGYVGHVLGVGAEFFLLWLVDDDLRPGGLVALRHQDISNLETPYLYADLTEKALALQGEAPPASVEVDLDTLEGLLQSCSRLAPILTLMVPSENDPPEEDEDEFPYPVALFIGQVQSLRDHIELLEINPSGWWETQVSGFGWDEVLGVIIQDHYGKQLYQVAEQNRLTQRPNPMAPVLRLAPSQD